MHSGVSRTNGGEDFKTDLHYSDVKMGAVASQITSLTIVYLTVYSGADHREHQISSQLAFVRGIHQWPVNFQHKWPVTRKMFPFDDVIMINLHKIVFCNHLFFNFGLFCCYETILKLTVQEIGPNRCGYNFLQNILHLAHDICDTKRNQHALVVWNWCHWVAIAY